jgi:hypothetical protein
VLAVTVAVEQVHEAQRQVLQVQQTLVAVAVVAEFLLQAAVA